MGKRSRIGVERRHRQRVGRAICICLFVVAAWAIWHQSSIRERVSGCLSIRDVIARSEASFALPKWRDCNNCVTSEILEDGTESQEGKTWDAPVVAFAISLTKLDSPVTSSDLLDAAEVLIDSIRKACRHSAYRCDTLAFVKPSVTEESRRLVEDMGWRILEKDLPVAVENIQNVPYRDRVVKSGCCGADEFLKLHAYTLTEYHRVLHLDVDTLILHPLDELMESEASLLYTTDPAMQVGGQKALPIQGGFLLVKPDLDVYERLRSIIREGDWQAQLGWCHSNIGWFYGGATIQGLLPYFYNVLAPGTAREINRCIYNHMFDSEECRSPRYSATIAAPASQVDMTYVFADGNRTAAGDEIMPIKSVHFTQDCPKPWKCAGKGHHSDGYCPYLHKIWLDGRDAILSTREWPNSKACTRNGYSPMQRGKRRRLSGSGRRVAQRHRAR